jgi:hypothetical protein
MSQDQLDIWRDEATALLEEMAPLKARLRTLQQRHAGLAWDIEALSRKRCAVKHIARGVSGKTKPTKKRAINTDVMMKQFTNLPAAAQAKLLEQLQAKL